MKKNSKKNGCTKLRILYLPQFQLSSFLPFVIKKNQELIVRDKTSGKVVVAVYRNRIGPDALKLMQETILEMFQLRHRVARPDGIAKLGQGSLAAAG